VCHASSPIRVTIVAAEPVAPVLPLPGPRFCPESVLRSMMGSGEVKAVQANSACLM
jgi:hypothetical protein